MQNDNPKYKQDQVAPVGVEQYTLEDDTVHVPYIGNDEQLPEITTKALILAVALSVILGATNVYGGLLVGVTTSASIPAAILSMGILRLFKDSNILENNQVQTAASAGESLAAGVIFTLPAMYLFEKESDVSEGWESYLTLENYAVSLGLCLFGGILGVLFSVPIRNALIVEQQTDPPLTFPEGIATANVLIKGHEGGSDSNGLKALLAGTTTGAAFNFLNDGLSLIKAAFHLAVPVNNSVLTLEFGVGPIPLAIGYIVRWKVALVMFLGSVVQFLFVVPLVQEFDPVVNRANFTDDYEYAMTTWSLRTRNMGVGAMLFGSLFVLFDIRSALVKGIKVGLKAVTSATAATTEENIPRTEENVNMKHVLAAVAFCGVMIWVCLSVFLGEWGKTIVVSVIVIVIGFLFSAVAGFNAGLVGSSNNPVSGVTISTVLVMSGVVRLLYGATPFAAPTAVLVGTIVCCAAAISGDNLQDLKAGYILGATPKKQVYMQILGVTVASFIMAPVLQVLAQGYGFGDSGKLSAPQASVMFRVSEGVVFNNTEWLYIGLGCASAFLVIVLDKVLMMNKSSFRVPVMAFAIGFYLPMEVGGGVLIGSLVSLIYSFESQSGLLYSAGIITGAGLMGLLIAMITVVYTLAKDTNESPFPSYKFSYGVNLALSLVQMVIIVATMLYFARVPDSEDESELVGDANKRVSIEGLSLPVAPSKDLDAKVEPEEEE